MLSALGYGPEFHKSFLKEENKIEEKTIEFIKLLIKKSYSDLEKIKITEEDFKKIKKASENYFSSVLKDFK